jgi:hypothetical protein
VVSSFCTPANSSTPLSDDQAGADRRQNGEKIACHYLDEFGYRSPPRRLTVGAILPLAEGSPSARHQAEQQAVHRSGEAAAPKLIFFVTIGVRIGRAPALPLPTRAPIRLALAPVLSTAADQVPSAQQRQPHRLYARYLLRRLLPPGQDP